MSSIHDKINPAKRFDTLCRRCVHALCTPHIHSSDADHFSSLPGCSDVFGHRFGLLDIAAHDAGVGAKVHHGAHLGTAYCAGAAGAEDHFVSCESVNRALGLFLKQTGDFRV